MKKLLALLMVLVMAFSLVACGGGEEEVEEVETEAVVEEAAGADDPISDESFATVQECYAQLVEFYNMFVETYNDDSFAADEEINNTLTEAKALIEEVGEIDRAELTEADGVELIEGMTVIVEVLTDLADRLAPAN